MKKVLSIACISLFLLTAGNTFADDMSTNALDEFNETTYSPEPPQAVGFSEVDDWTNWNKFWYASAVATYGVGDVVSTLGALDRGCAEGNPVFGEDPSAGLLIGAKLVYFGGVWYVIEHMADPENRQKYRNWTYGISTVVGAGVTISNSTIDCY